MDFISSKICDTLELIPTLFMSVGCCRKTHTADCLLLSLLTSCGQIWAMFYPFLGWSEGNFICKISIKCVYFYRPENIFWKVLFGAPSVFYFLSFYLRMAWRISTTFSHKVEGWTGSNPIENERHRFNRLAAILEKHCFPAPSGLLLASYIYMYYM